MWMKQSFKQTFSTIIRSPTWILLLLTFTVPEIQKVKIKLCSNHSGTIHNNLINIFHIYVRKIGEQTHHQILMSPPIWVNCCPACFTSHPREFGKVIFRPDLKECWGSWAFSLIPFGLNGQICLEEITDLWTLPVTCGLCICKTLKHINIAMHKGFIGLFFLPLSLLQNKEKMGHRSRFTYITWYYIINWECGNVPISVTFLA